MHDKDTNIEGGDMTLITKARVFATAAHAAVGQLRKYTNEPYSVHPEDVAVLVASVPHTEAMIATAFLHDVLEDTNVTEDLLRLEFGDEVTDLVVWLTKVEDENDNRATRKAKELIRLSQAPAEAQTIKLADLISNTPSIVTYDPDFAVIFLKEKKALAEVLVKGDQTLRAFALLDVMG
jgi:(p)ppGpp synthase/HD superfamily hydrolase